jgi:hypothetical protein
MDIPLLGIFSRHSIQVAHASTPPKTEKLLTTKARNIISFVDMLISLSWEILPSPGKACVDPDQLPDLRRIKVSIFIFWFLFRKGNRHGTPETSVLFNFCLLRACRQLGASSADVGGAAPPAG